MAGDHLNLGASHIDFIWHDGGRASSGFVGAAGDCVTRAIAIATGIAYRSIYNDLKELNDGSPRDGHGDRIKLLSEHELLKEICVPSRSFSLAL